MVHVHGGDIYSYQNTKHQKLRDFSANINFRGMPEAVSRAAAAAVADCLHYPDPGYRSLRAVLAARERSLQQKRGKRESITASQVICGNGAAELMFSLASALGPRRALLASPSFFEYEQALSVLGCRIFRHSLREEQDFSLGEDILESFRHQPDVLILGNPNNPTGRLVEEPVMARILEECRRRNTFLVLDESFLDFLEGGDLRRTLAGEDEIAGNPRLFVIKSFTKIYGMPGLRFGYGLCSDGELLEKMRGLMQPWNVSVPAQAAAEQAAGELDFARETAEQTAENRERMRQGMDAAGYRVYPSETNFLLFRGPACLKEECLKYGFLIRDCGNFPGLETLPGEMAYFRICIRSAGENEELLEVLEQIGRTHGIRERQHRPAGNWR